MAKFMFIYRGGDAAGRTPEEKQATMTKWMTWVGGAMQQGWMVDPGDGLTAECRLVKPNVVTDGPFVEAKEMVGGFSLVEADSIDAAVKLARGCPGLETGGTVEVRPLAGHVKNLQGAQ